MTKRVMLLSVASLAIMALLASGCGGHETKLAGVKKERVKTGKRVAKIASSMIGIRYRYGGKTPRRGFDCSGLVQYSYKRAGIRVPRNTRYQRRHSYRISHQQLRKGDLLFFNQEGKWASHVGIYIGKGRFVHAPSSGKRVRISSMRKRYWRRHLESIRRFNIRF